MKLATRDHLNVLPIGAGTWLTAGDEMRSSDIVLSTRRMTRFIAHEPSDLVASAEAGATCSIVKKNSPSRASGCHWIRPMMAALHWGASSPADSQGYKVLRSVVHELS